MKKKFLLLLSIGLLTTACGKIPTTKNGEQALVTFKDGTKISVDEVYNKLKEKYALNAIVPMIDKYVLEKEFPKEIDNAKKQAETTVNAFSQQYGGDEALLKILQQYGYKDIDEFKETYYISNLESIATKEYAKTLISDKDIEKYYKDKTYGDVSIKHILIIPEVKDNATDDEKKKAEEKAKKTVNDIINTLKEAKDKKTKFEELAKKYSQDDDTKEKGGDLGYINYGKLSSSYDELVDAALKLKNGEVSTKIITTELGYHVIYRVDQKEKAKLSDVKDSIKTTLAEEKISSDSTISGQALQHYRKKNEVTITDSSVKSQYANYVQSTLTNQDTKEEN